MLHAPGVQWNDRKYWWRAGGCCGAWDSIFASAQTGVGSGRNAQKKQKMAVLFLNEQDYGSSISSLAVVELLGVGVLGLVDLLLRDSGAFGEEAGQAVQHAQVALDVVHGGHDLHLLAVGHQVVEHELGRRGAHGHDAALLYCGATPHATRT